VLAAGIAPPFFVVSWPAVTLIFPVIVLGELAGDGARIKFAEPLLVKPDEPAKNELIVVDMFAVITGLVVPASVSVFAALVSDQVAGVARSASPRVRLPMVRLASRLTAKAPAGRSTVLKSAVSFAPSATMPAVH